jgi:hypothetical protein
MTKLTELERADMWADFMRELSSDGQSIGITKQELRAAIDALDDFMDDSAATINAAIPQPARTSLTVQQKALMLSYVVLKRYKVI